MTPPTAEEIVAELCRVLDRKHAGLAYAPAMARVEAKALRHRVNSRRAGGAQVIEFGTHAKVATVSR